MSNALDQLKSADFRDQKFIALLEKDRTSEKTW